MLSLLRSPFSTQGILCRHQYMMALLLFLIGSQLALFIGAQLGLGYDSLLLMIPSYHMLVAQGIRRCRAMRKSGWFQFIPFAFVYMLIKETELDEQKNIALHIDNTSDDMGDTCNFCHKHD